MSRRDAIWRWFLGVGLVAVAVFLALPRGSPGLVFVHLGLHALLVVAIVVGIRMHRPARPLPWYLFLAGSAMYLAGNVLWYPTQVSARGPLPFPSIGDPLYLGAYSFFVLGFATLAAAQRRSARTGALVDALIVVVGLSSLSWVFLSEQRASSMFAPAAAAVAGGYQLLELLLLGAVSWLLFARHRRPAVLWLLVAFVLTQLAGDVGYGLAVVDGTSAFGGPMNAMWTLSFAFLGAAALHPTMRELDEPGVDEAGKRWALPRIVVAIALAPTVLVVEQLLGRTPHPGLVAGIVLVVVPLAIIRLRSLTVDIDRHRRTEEELTRSERRFRTLVEQSPGFTYIDARDDSIPTGVRSVWISPQVTPMLGRTPEELVEDPDLWNGMLHPEDRERYLSEEARLLETGEPKTSEFRMIRTDGRVVWLRDEAAVVPGASGSGAFVQGVIYDITEPKLAEGALKESEARFRALLDDAPDAVIAVDAEGTILVTNRETERMFGYGAHEIVGLPVDDLVPDGSRRGHAAHRAEYATTPGIRPMGEGLELTGRRKDGTVFPVEISLGSVPAGASGTGPIFIAFARDVTTRRRLDTALREAEERYRTLVEQLPAFVYVEAPDPGNPWGTRTTYLSPYAERLTGVPAAEFIDDPGTWDRLVHPDDLPREHNLYARLLATGEAIASDVRFVRPDGRVIWLHHEAAMLPGRPGAGTFVQGILFDVTESRETQQRLHEAEERWRMLLEHLPVTPYLIEYETGLRLGSIREHWIGPGIEDLLGVTPEEWVADHDAWEHAIHPDDWERVRDDWLASSERAGAFKAEYRMVRRDGRIVWVLDQATTSPRDGSVRAEGVFIDITSSREAQQALVEAEERYRTLVERIPAIVYVAQFGEPAPWLYVSPQAGPMLGYEPQEWIDDESLWMRLVHPDDLAHVLETERASHATGERFEYEYRMIARDGRVVWIHDESEVVPDQAGAPTLLRGIMYDVTERRLAEDALRRHDRILEAVSLAGEALLTDRWEDHVDDVLRGLGEAAEASRAFLLTAHAGADGELLFSYRAEWCAPGIESLIGNPTLYDIAIRRPPYSRWGDILAAGGIVHGPVRDFPAAERESLEGQGVRSFAAVPLLIGGELWGELGFDECATERVWDPQELEALRAAAGVLAAAEARQRSDDATRASEDRFRLLSDATVQGVIVDVDGSIVEANRAFCELFGLDPAEVVGSSPADAVASESLPAVIAHLSGGSEEPQDLEVVRKQDGERLVLEVTVKRVEHDGRAANLVTMHDITARKNAEDALATINEKLDQLVHERTHELQAANADLTAAKETAEDANRAKSEFLSRASHELRTPLNAILGFGQLLEAASLADDDRESVTMIVTAGRHLLELVDKVLDIARIDAGRLTLTLLPVPLDQVVDQAFGVTAADARARGVELIRDPHGEPATVMADGQRLVQAIVHLLAGAIERSGEGDRVTVSCEQDGALARVHVSDTAQEVPESRLATMFSLFGSLDQAAEGPRDAGLGLPLARAWIEAMGGALDVRSEAGVGTTFTVALVAAEEPRTMSPRSGVV